MSLVVFVKMSIVFNVNCLRSIIRYRQDLGAALSNTKYLINVHKYFGASYGPKPTRTIFSLDVLKKTFLVKYLWGR